MGPGGVKCLRTAAFLARQPGLSVLVNALFDNPLVDLRIVLTHSHAPLAEGGGIRPEVSSFERVTKERGVPFVALDSMQSRQPHNWLPSEDIDAAVVLSWRYLLPSATLRRFRVGGVNLHRGKLPEYAGAEPVRRMIEAGERHAVITAHWITEELDAGEILGTVQIPIAPKPHSISAGAHAEAVKAKLVPLYAPLARLAVAAMSTC